MTSELEYSSVLTGAAFMFFEFKQVVMLKEQGLSDQEIRKKVVDENLFQHTKISSLKRGFPSILRRANVLDSTLRKMVIEDSIEVGKAINFYAILKTDRLFFEFVEEVVQEKLAFNNYSLEKKDLNTYFAVKAEQNSNIARWTEATVQKLKQIYLKILLDAGMLADKKSGELNRLVMDEQVKGHLLRIGEVQFVQVMGE